MKFYERRLLDHLQATKSVDIPLENIRKSLGAVSHMVGNPLSKTEITLNVQSFLYTNAGVPIAPAALPAAFQNSIPVYIFGLTDFYGGYLKSQNLIPIRPLWGLVNPLGQQTAYIYNYGNILPLGGAFDLLIQPQSGDMLLFYGNAGLNVNACIRIRCQNVAYGTFLNSFVSDLITIETIRYIVPLANINQFINPVIFVYQTLFGKTSSDTIDPRLYITNKDFQQQIADLPINLPIDKNLMIGLQMDVFCPTFSWVLFVKKVEPLTHK